MRKISLKYIALVTIISITSSSHLVIADNFSLNIGSNFTSGKYGKKKATHIWYVPITARYRYGRAAFRVTIPYLNITRPVNVRNRDIITFGQSSNTLGVIRGVSDASTTKSKRVTREGLGDTTLAFTYNLIYHKASRTRFDITGRLKIPTGNMAQGLSTGKVGYAVQTNLYKSIARFNLSAIFGYRMPGNPTGINFKNTFYGGVGAGYRTSSRSMFGTRFNISQSALKLQDSRTLMAYFIHQYDKNIVIHFYGLQGFSERSPDWGSGISFRYIL